MGTFTTRRRQSQWASTVLTLTPALWGAFSLLVLTFGLGDIVSTGLALHLSAGQEGNPIAALSLQGGLLGLALAKVFVLFCVYGLTRLVISRPHRTSRHVITSLLFAVGVLYGIVTFSNLLAAYAGADLFHYFFS